MAKIIIREYFLIIIGSFFIAAGMNMFLVPMQLSSGGVGTIGTIMLYLFGIPISLTNVVINAVLFLCGYRFLGKDSVIKTLTGILFFSLFLEVTGYFPSFSSDIILSAVCGGILVGLGVGCVVRVGGSTGGSDFAGIIIKRFVPHISVATFIFFIDSVVIIISGIVFKSYAVTFYSALSMLICARVVDIITVMGDNAKSIIIMTDKSEEITKVIHNEFDRGVTLVYSRGGYSCEDRFMLLCVVSPKQAPKIIKTVKEVDTKAFIIILDAREVLGEGFK